MSECKIICYNFISMRELTHRITFINLTPVAETSELATFCSALIRDLAKNDPCGPSSALVSITIGCIGTYHIWICDPFHKGLFDRN